MLLPPFFPCILFLLLSSFTSHISFLRICFSFILIFFRFFSPTYQGRKSSILCLRTSVSAPPLFFWFYFYFISRFPFFFCHPYPLLSNLVHLSFIYFVPSSTIFIAPQLHLPPSFHKALIHLVPISHRVRLHSFFIIYINTRPYFRFSSRNK